MAGLRVKVEGDRAVIAGIAQWNPAMNPRIMGMALTEMAMLTMRTAAQRHIRRGGGGKPRPNILTSRTGALRSSLTQESGSIGKTSWTGSALDDSGLPRSVEAGSSLVYAAIHERSARSFLAPALAESSRSFEAIYLKHWERAIR